MRDTWKKLFAMGLAALLFLTIPCTAIYADTEQPKEAAVVSGGEDDALSEQSENAAEDLKTDQAETASVKDSPEVTENALIDKPEESSVNAPVFREESSAETGDSSEALTPERIIEEADVPDEAEPEPVIEAGNMSDVSEEVVGQAAALNSAISIKKAIVAGISISYGYTGKAYTPSFTVTVNGAQLVNNRDYTYKFTNNKNPGIGKLTITGKGKYTGTYVHTFAIVKCASELKPNKTYNLIPKNNINTAVCAYSGKMVNNTKVYITNKSSSEAMKFRLSLNDNGTWKLINQKCDLVVAVQQNNTQVGKGIVLYKNTTREKQNWRFVKKYDNSFAIINDVSNLSIAMSDPTAVKGTTLSLAKTASTGLQRFYFVETTGVDRPDDTPYFTDCIISSAYYDPDAIFDSIEYDIGSEPDCAMAMLIPQSNSEGSDLLVGGYSSYDYMPLACRYNILYSGGGYYRFENLETGMVVTATNTKIPGTNTMKVVQKTWNASEGQRWRFVGEGSGFHSLNIVNLMGTALQTTDIAMHDSFDVNVVAAQPASVIAQKWYFWLYY